jgi:mannose-6-phosphate isomerase-like protein (cupin superfamily)
MALRSRRVVTGHDKSGKAVILRDDVPEVTVRARTGGRAQQMWYTAETPAEEVTAADPTGKITGTNPPLTGSIFRILEIPAESSYTPRTEADADEHRKSTGVEVGPLGKGKHPGMHRTHSIDYALILDGEIDMLLDDSEVHCKAGDVMIQQGTNHAWANRSKGPCTIAFILIGATVPWK